MLLEQRFKELKEQGLDPDVIIVELISKPKYDTKLEDGRNVIFDASDRVNLKVIEEDGSISLERKLQGLELLFLQEATRCYLGVLASDGFIIQQDRNVDLVATEMYNSGIGACVKYVTDVATDQKQKWDDFLATSNGTQNATSYHTLYEGLAVKLSELTVASVKVQLEQAPCLIEEQGEQNVG